MRRLLCFAVLMFSVAGFAQTWSPFTWSPVERGGKTFNRALIYVPVTVDNLKGNYRMLLDTTAPETVLYGNPYRKLFEEAQGSLAAEKIPPARGERTRLRTSFTVGSFRFQDMPIHLREGYDPPDSFTDEPPVIGTIGLDLLADRIWIIDYPRARFSVLEPGAPLPKDLEKRMIYFDAVQHDERLFVPVSVGAGTFPDFVFDTTYNLAPILTTKPIWQQMTGRWGDEKNNAKFTEKAGDAEVVYLGWRTTLPFRVGNRPLSRVMAEMLDSGPASLRVENWPFHANGVIGNAPFAGSILVVDLPHNRMGIVGPPRKG